MLHTIALLIFYIGACFNPNVGWFYEAPNAAPNTYWLYSDNYLVTGQELNVNGWDIPQQQRWRPLVEGVVVDEEVYTYGSKPAIVFQDDDMTILSEIEDPTIMLEDWQEYADRVLLAALNARNAGDSGREAELMAIAMSMWDGRGFQDKVYRADMEEFGVARYETYKTAIHYYMTGDKDALKILKNMQERDPKSNRFGGIYTEYDDNLEPLAGTDTNIETTAVTLRALLGS